MKLEVNLPADLETIIKKQAEQSGVDLHTYVLQTLRRNCKEPTLANLVSDKELAASIERLRAIHAKANPNFDDSRASIYAGRGE